MSAKIVAFISISSSFIWLHAKHFLSIDKLLKNANVSQIRTVENPTTETTKPENFCCWSKGYKKVKITKRAHAFENYAHSYNIEILNYFNSELQLKNTKSVIKNKLKDFIEWIERV